MADQAPLKKQPDEAFTEDLTLTKDEIQQIQADASTNVQASIQENKTNDEHPDKTVTGPPDYTGPTAS